MAVKYIWHCKTNERSIRPRQRGFAMFETLVAILVVSLGIIGFMELLKFSLRNDDSAGYRAQASFLTSEIMERMRTSRDDALAHSYNIGCGDPENGEEDDDDDTEIGETNATVTGDLSQWCANIVATLPEGEGGVDCNAATGSCLVTISWNDSRGTDGDAKQAFAVRSLL